MIGRVEAVVGNSCCRALAWCCAFAGALAACDGAAASLAEKARESGCNSKPVLISSGLYKCVTASGSDAFFNLLGASSVVAILVGIAVTVVASLLVTWADRSGKRGLGQPATA